MKKILTLTLAVIMILAAFSTLAVGATEDTVAVSYYTGKADTSWYDASKVEKEYAITSADQLAGLSEIVRGGQKFEGVTFYLECDIVWNAGKLTMDENGMPLYNGKAVGDENKPMDFTPIGNYIELNTANDPGISGNYFFGNFDGQGHVISGLYVYEPEESAVGFFTVFAGEYIKDLSIVNSYFGTFARSATFAGFVYTVKEKGTVSDAGTLISGLYSDAMVVAFNSTDGQNGRLGGIIGLMLPINYAGARARSNGCTQIIENCWFAGSIQHIAGTRYTGGILGVMAGSNTSNKVKLEMNNCLMTGAFYMGLDHKEALRVGGIIGNIWQGTATLKNSVSAISDTNVLPNNYFNEDDNGKCVFLGCHESAPSAIIYENCHYKPMGSFDHRSAAIHTNTTPTVTGTPTEFTDWKTLSSALEAQKIFDFSGDALALALRTELAPHEAPEPPEEPETPENTDTDEVTDTENVPETNGPTDTVDAPETDAPSTTDMSEEKGCAGFGAVSLLAVIALGAAAVTLKKKY